MAESNSPSWFVPIIISGQGKMVCWLVGGKCVVPDHPRWTLDSPRHFQTSKGTNTNNFPVNQNHPRRPQTPLTEPQKIQDFQLFWNRSSDFDPPRLNYQLHPRSMTLKSQHTIWMDSFGAKDGIIKVERWLSLTHRPNLFLSLYRVKAIWSVGWSVANVLSQIIPDQH